MDWGFGLWEQNLGCRAVHKVYRVTLCVSDWCGLHLSGGNLLGMGDRTQQPGGNELGRHGMGWAVLAGVVSI